MVRICLGISLLAALCWLASGLACPKPVFSQSDLEIATVNGARENPFLTKEEELEFAEQGTAIPLEYLHVSAIFYSNDENKSRAIVNGKVLAKGDSIDNKEVARVNPEDVLLQDAQGQYVVRMNKVLSQAAYKR